MPVILGIDTGGTYTDSVIVDAVSRQVLCKAKAFTTRQDLLCGIAQSLDRMHYAHPDEIVMVCLSTTLATNAVVEGQSGRVGALLLGRDAAGSLPAVQVRRLRGTLDIKGRILRRRSSRLPMRSAVRWTPLPSPALPACAIRCMRPVCGKSYSRSLMCRSYARMNCPPHLVFRSARSRRS